MLHVDLANQQQRQAVDGPRLIEAARRVLTEEGVRAGSLSLAVVDDDTMRRLNRQYLQHDYATDVLSFVLDGGGERLDGEVIVSADTAAAECVRYGWNVGDELLLYVIHGTLHLVCYDDQTPADQAAMRAKEAAYLARFGLTPRYAEESLDG